MIAHGQNLRIDPNRPWDSLMEMAKIGPGVAGGNNRQTLTDEDAEGRAFFKSWCDAAGLDMGLDTMGNIFATCASEDPDALEVVRTLNDLDVKTKHPIVITNRTKDEGNRYAPAMLSSGVFAGKHTQAGAYERVDADGKAFSDELKRIGWVGDEEVGARKMHAMFELHIELGPMLEAEGKDIGVVTHGPGLRWIECTATGKESHTGSTPMSMQKNMGRGLALITELVHEIAMKNQPNAVGAIGHIDVYPNSRNIIPGKVVFTVDMRPHLLEKLNAMFAEFMERAPKPCEGIGVSFDCHIVGQFDPPACDENCVSAVRNAAKELGYSHMDIVSEAGHDACWINDVAPTAMIMCPCVDGLSHSEGEDITKEWAQAGTDVMLHAVLNTAEIAE